MRTATETAVGMPPAAPVLVYPVTARVNVSDSYFGTEVEDPYRWLENLDSPSVHEWVTAQNALSQPRLAALPQRAWLKARLTQLWNYERYDVPVKRGGHYFFLHNDGRQNQSVLFVADSLDAPAACCSIRTRCARMPPLPLSEFSPDVQGTCSRLRGLGRRHRLADLALQARARWRRSSRPAAIHEILGRVVGARRVGRVLQPLSGAAQRQGRRLGKARRVLPQAGHAHRITTALVYEVTRPSDAHPRRTGHRRRALPRHHTVRRLRAQRRQPARPAPPGRAGAAAVLCLGCALYLHRCARR